MKPIKHQQGRVVKDNEHIKDLSKEYFEKLFNEGYERTMNEEDQPNLEMVEKK